jgi:acyl carrier protein
MNVDMKWQKLQQKIYLIICRKDIVINKEKVNKKLFELIKKVLETDNIDISTTMDNIPEWDSLKHIQLITSIEEEFNFEVSFEESISMVDVKNILEIVDIKTNS